MYNSIILEARLKIHRINQVQLNLKNFKNTEAKVKLANEYKNSLARRFSCSKWTLLSAKFVTNHWTRRVKIEWGRSSFGDIVFTPVWFPLSWVGSNWKATSRYSFVVSLNQYFSTSPYARLIFPPPQTLVSYVTTKLKEAQAGHNDRIHGTVDLCFLHSVGQGGEAFTVSLSVYSISNV